MAALAIVVILGCAAFVPLRYRIADNAVWIGQHLYTVTANHGAIGKP